MRRTRACRIHDYGGPGMLRLDEIPIPSPVTSQVLVEAEAAGVNGLDCKARQGLLKDSVPLTLPAVLGCELADVVVPTEAGAGRFKVKDRVMGPIGFGVYADYAAVDEATLCLASQTMTAAPDIAVRTPAGQRGLWFSMHLDSGRLGQTARHVAKGRLCSTIAEIVASACLPAAIKRTRTGHGPGKIVADFTR